jgi:hypothetical protein
LAFAWLPPEVTSGAKSSTGFVRLSGAAHDAKLFIKDPLLSGYILPIGDQPKLLVYLHTR